MHEHNITNEVVHQILHECEDRGITKPKQIVVELGTLTGYKKESVLFYFDSIKKEEPLLKNAKLHIVEIPGKIFCKICKKEYMIEPLPIQLCPNCNTTNVKVLQGKDIAITEMK